MVGETTPRIRKYFKTRFEILALRNHFIEMWNCSKKKIISKRGSRRRSYKTGKKEGDRFPKTGDLALLYHVLLRLENICRKLHARM